MANQTVGLNVQDKNPYNMTVTGSGTLIGKDVELVYNQATVLTRNDLVVAVQMLLEFVQQDGQITGFGPPG